MAFNLGVSVTEADSDRCGRMSSAASSTRLYFNTKTRTEASAAALPGADSAAGTASAVSEMAMTAAKRILFLTRMKNPAPESPGNPRDL
jgi:hypothetical protein